MMMQEYRPTWRVEPARRCKPNSLTGTPVTTGIAGGYGKGVIPVASGKQHKRRRACGRAVASHRQDQMLFSSVVLQLVSAQPTLTVAFHTTYEDNSLPLMSMLTGAAEIVILTSTGQLKHGRIMLQFTANRSQHDNPSHPSHHSIAPE